MAESGSPAPSDNDQEDAETTCEACQAVLLGADSCCAQCGVARPARDRGADRTVPAPSRDKEADPAQPRSALRKTPRSTPRLRISFMNEAQIVEAQAFRDENLWWSPAELRMRSKDIGKDIVLVKRPRGRPPSSSTDPQPLPDEGPAPAPVTATRAKRPRAGSPTTPLAHPTEDVRAKTAVRQKKNPLDDSDAEPEEEPSEVAHACSNVQVRESVPTVSVAQLKMAALLQRIRDKQRGGAG